jgi:nitric oxide synthase oxygenase domain/subunit
LNYAVQHSYIREKVTMSDSLTASIKFQRYDDEYQKKHGYRLPSDPFWVAPPQGSIVPIWHRGAAPNYQPKPMICRHVQDPSKAWKREQSSWPLAAAKIFSSANI